MELNREQIIKALECCANNDECVGEACPYYTTGCEKQMPKDALTLIKELTEEVESLKQCTEHEHASFMETFGELDDKCKRLTEENERLRKHEITYETPTGKQTMPDLLSLDGDAARLYTEIRNKTVADTVRKMKELIKERCIKGGIYPAFVASTIDQIANELMEGKNATN